jgi:hypothetical protein
MSTISSDRFYREYYGHRLQDLEIVLEHLRSSNFDRLIWTAGDSSLDNKYWFRETAQALNSYQLILSPPRMKQDIVYWLNFFAEQENNRHADSSSSSSSPYLRTAAINAAVEATTLNERTFKLRSQDEFIRDNICPEDILIVSVGGNDVALLPSPCTIAAMAGLICCCPIQCIQKGVSCGAVPFDDCCWGCGPSLLSCACAGPPCLGYLRHMFGTRIQHYIEKLTSKTKPAKVLVCMIYYPDEANNPAWAGAALGALGYNKNPVKLQAIIAKGFQEAISMIHIPGTRVIPVPLFRVLDGKNTNDYVQRVEPSAEGGRKMAEFLMDIITREHTTSNLGMPARDATSSPRALFIRERD